MVLLLGIYSLSFSTQRLVRPFFFFFNDTATTEIYTLSLHDALPISAPARTRRGCRNDCPRPWRRDRKSTRLNSSHQIISYAVFCLKKKKIRRVRLEQHHPDRRDFCHIFSG